MAPPCRYWLLKTEPQAFSIADLAASPRQTTCWDGVRNFQARNFIRDDMRLGDRVLVYHSNAQPPAVAGTATVVREAYPDHTAWDPNDEHYDPKSTPRDPIWLMVDIRLERVFTRAIGLDELRALPGLAKMELLRKGSRLSVQPVSADAFAIILALADRDEQRGTPVGQPSAILAQPANKRNAKRPAAPTRSTAPRRGATRAAQLTANATANSAAKAAAKPSATAAAKPSAKSAATRVSKPGAARPTKRPEKPAAKQSAAKRAKSSHRPAAKQGRKRA